jgi:hypothetical protein
LLFAGLMGDASAIDASAADASAADASAADAAVGGDSGGVHIIVAGQQPQRFVDIRRGDGRWLGRSSRA